jgi:hypothetical protein
MIDQDPAHHLRRNAVKMRATLPGNALLPDEPQVRFVDEGGRLKGVVGSLATEVRGGAAPQLLVDQGHQLVPSIEAASAPGLQ